MKKINDFSVIPRLKKITFAAAITAAASALLIFIHTNLVVIIILCLLLYIFILVAFKEPMLTEIARITRLQDPAADTSKENASEKVPAVQPIVATARIGKTLFSAEVVKDTEAINKGLSGRDSLEPGKAMLFMFPRPKKYRFWMRGMRFPIDIIWIYNDTIVGITARVAPEPNASNQRFYYAPQKANYVLEVAAGLAARKNISVGDHVTLEGTRRALAITPAEESARRHDGNEACDDR
jgi:uncharacterized membrane protein (UPF0127 family)